MKWRPDGWINPYQYIEEQQKCTTLMVGTFQGKRAFEEGADAMLKALRRNAETTVNGQGENCRIVFIPDEES